jgi:HKD family nuclease
MKLEFIGHGLNNKSKTVHYYLRKSLIDSKFNSFIGFSAYTKKSGIDLIAKELLEAKSRFKNIVFYLGMAEKGTSKEALDFFLDNGIKTYTFCSNSSFIFHPKIFLFEGEFEKRMIIGSSNLTKSGLAVNGNIEASILINYSKLDSSGLKLQRQYFEYFADILNGENEFVEILTPNLLKQFIENGIVVEEKFTTENLTSWRQHNNRIGKIERILQKEEILNIENEPKKVKKKRNKNKIGITDRYLETWEDMFLLFKEFSKRTGRIAIPKDYSNYALYRWYRLQKIFYADDSIDDEYDLKYEHIDKLEKAGFYFGDSRDLMQQNIEDEWLSILTDAFSDLKEKYKVQVNHRYIFNGHHLGTWLVGVIQANKKKDAKSRKIDLKRKIEDIGFDFTKTSRKPEHASQRFIDDLLNEDSPIKPEYQKRFNSQILPRKDKIEEEIRQEINIAWDLQFNEKRTWDRISRDKDRTDEWKEFRYNININPEGKWFMGQSVMGKLYNWVYHKRNDKKKLDLVINKFNENEILELIGEGFPV